MKKIENVDIAIVGAGIAGIATAYYLCKKYQRKSVLLIDARDPMSYTTAQSGDNYRNWWPSELMTALTNHSIDLMYEVARESSNFIQMKQRGYVLATRRTNIDDLLATLEANYSKSDGLIRKHIGVNHSGVNHSGVNQSAYLTPYNDNWKSSVDGVDVISAKSLIEKTFPAFSADINNVLHIRRAGDFSSQQMGEYMLQQIKALGAKRLRGQVLSVDKGGRYAIEVQTKDEVSVFNADVLINAAGPHVGEIANMLDIDLPIQNVFHQKMAFEDPLAAVPRNQPFSIDVDQVNLDWSDEERLGLNEDPSLKWLTNTISGGVHSRPEGSGQWVKLGWAYNTETSIADNGKELIEDANYDANFPEIVLRGASRLNPSLKPYIESLPTKRVHYGGYYTMTKENWPLVGPLDSSGAFVVGALSGFGCMSACALGALCADWVCDGQLPEYAHALSLKRYQDPVLLTQMAQTSDVGLL